MKIKVVNDGDECSYGDWLERKSSTAFLLDGALKIHVIINRYQDCDGGDSKPIEAETRVQPVRLIH